MKNSKKKLLNLKKNKVERNQRKYSCIAFPFYFAPFTNKANSINIPITPNTIATIIPVDNS